MRPTLAVLALLLATPALAGPRRGPVRPVAAFPGDAEVVQLDRAIRDLEVLAESVGSPAVARSLRQRITELRQAAAGLDAARWQLADEAAALEQEALACQRRERHRPPVVVIEQPPPPPVEPPPPTAITQAELQGILRAMDEASFSDGKLAVLTSAARSRWFSVGQVVQIMNELSFGKDKVEAAAILHEAVVDPQNWFQVYGALTFESDKRKLRQRIGD